MPAWRGSPSAITETFAYDAASRLTGVTDDNFHTTGYTYDVLGRSTRTTYADTKYVERDFDANGNVVEWTDQNGTVVTNTYDDEDRLATRSISKGTGVGGVTSESFGRDALGRIISAVNNDYKVLLDWDSVGNLLSDQQGYNILGSEQWKTASATWSIAGAMTGLTYPDTFAISHGRDSIHRLTSITDVGSTATIVDYAWQGLGRKASVTNENGTVTEYAYDGFRRVTEIDHKLSSAGASFHLLEYAYDDVHNRRMEKHSFDATWISGLPSAVQSFLNARDTKGDVYEYDWAYRMVTAKYSVSSPASEVATPGSQTYVTKTDYTLDGLGNRSQVGVTPYGGGTATTTYSSDVVNQYTSIASVGRTHDDNGNLSDDGNQEYIYDYANHLIEVKASGSSTIATYMYDALGRRVEKDVSGGSMTRYLLWGQSVIQEVDGSGTWLARYVQTDRIDFPCAMDRADVADVDGDTNTSEVLRFHYHQQALGSVTEISDENGAVVEWVTYDVYGGPTIRDQAGSTVGSSAVGSPFLFTGREYDAECGLYHYRARAYDPQTGRFLQRDPLGYVDGMNDREYVRSEPAARSDPSGRKSSAHDEARAEVEAAAQALMAAGKAVDAATAKVAALKRALAAAKAAEEQWAAVISYVNCKGGPLPTGREFDKWNRLKGDVAKAEAELAKAEAELAAAEKALKEAAARLAAAEKRLEQLGNDGDSGGERGSSVPTPTYDMVQNWRRNKKRHDDWENRDWDDDIGLDEMMDPFNLSRPVFATFAAVSTLLADLGLSAAGGGTLWAEDEYYPGEFTVEAIAAVGKGMERRPEPPRTTSAPWRSWRQK